MGKIVHFEKHKKARESFSRLAEFDHLIIVGIKGKHVEFEMTEGMSKEIAFGLLKLAAETANKAFCG